jgi:hypothetical protein
MRAGIAAFTSVLGELLQKLESAVLSGQMRMMIEVKGGKRNSAAR